MQEIKMECLYLGLKKLEFWFFISQEILTTRVILTIDFSQTEIHLKAKHEKTGKEVKVVLDYP